MPRPKKDVWLENCFRCKNMIRTKYLENGRDEGAVGFRCSITDKEVMPYKIDGCKKYSGGEPQTIIEDHEKSNNIKRD